MTVTYTLKETFTGKRTQVMPDPEGEITEEITETLTNSLNSNISEENSSSLDNSYISENIEECF